MINNCDLFVCRRHPSNNLLFPIRVETNQVFKPNGTNRKCLQFYTDWNSDYFVEWKNVYLLPVILKCGLGFAYTCQFFAIKLLNCILLFRCIKYYICSYACFGRTVVKTRWNEVVVGSWDPIAPTHCDSCVIVADRRIR